MSSTVPQLRTRIAKRECHDHHGELASDFEDLDTLVYGDGPCS